MKRKSIRFFLFLWYELTEGAFMIIACLHAAASANQTSNGTRIKQNKHIQKLIAFIVVDVLLASSLEFLVENLRLFIHFKVLFASSL